MNEIYTAGEEGAFHLAGKGCLWQRRWDTSHQEWLQEVGMRLRLRELGCKLDPAEEIAELAVGTGPSLRRHPRPVDATAIAQIYKESC